MKNFLFQAGPDPVSLRRICIFAAIGAAGVGLAGTAYTQDFQAVAVFVVAGAVFGAIVAMIFDSDSQSPRFTQHKRVYAENKVAHVKPQAMVEVASAIVVFLTILGLVVGFLFPGKLTGAILPLALIAWSVLYRLIDRRES